MNLEVLWSGLWPNKRLVLTMPARRSFNIRARHKHWVVAFASCCRSGRWHGRTSEALDEASQIQTSDFKPITGKISL
jgi:hypothetical protein